MTRCKRCNDKTEGLGHYIEADGYLCLQCAWQELRLLRRAFERLVSLGNTERAHFLEAIGEDE